MVHFASSGSILVLYSKLVSEGMDQNNIGQLVRTTSVTCEPAYGFLPCTTKVWGQLFLIMVYQYLLSLSEKYISSGSDLFFEIFGTGVFGASMFQILGVFPLIILVLVTGISISEDAIGSAASMAMGVLAGTTIMNLTIIWGSVVAFGSYNLSESLTSSSNWKTKFSFNGFGVKTDKETKYTARIMLLSMIPFLLLQLAKVFSSDSGTRVVVLFTLIVTAGFLITYCTYQVFRPWMQNRRLEYLMRSHLQKKLLPVLCNPDGKPSETKISELFDKLDQNNDSQVSADELRSLIIGIRIEDVGLNADDVVSKVMLDFDVSGDSLLSRTEFIQGLSNWLSKVGPAANTRSHNRKTLCGSNVQGTSEMQQSEVAKASWRNYAKATFLIFLGTAITILLAQSLLQTVQAFSVAIKIPSFLVSYFMIPFALSARQAYRAIISAREKTENTVSLTLSEIYGGVFMNNVMGLIIFLGLVYIRHLSWDVSAEVLVVLVICSAVGFSASFTSKFPFWTGIIAYALYPVSLALIYALTTFCGWG